jgi:hypothetical protein
MTVARRLGLWLVFALAAGLATEGCGLVIGIGDVPTPAGGVDAGIDATQDGKSPREDGPITNADGRTPADSAGGGKDGSTTAPPDTGPPDVGASVLEYHVHPSRDGHYVDPLMTPTYAASLTLDTTFDGTIGGPLWGQVLYVENGVASKGTFYVADDSNNVYAIDETTGKPVVSKTPLAMSAGQYGSGCGNVSPVGITSAPYIDLSTRTMYLAAAVGTGSGVMTYQIHALSIDDLSEVSGWPIDVTTITGTGGVTFNPPPEGQRGGLALVNGMLYVSWGGEDGDCGDYHGWVITVPVSNPKMATGYATAAQGGGIWAVGGLTSDGTDLFAVTGNATGGSGSAWADYQSEAVIRFHDGTSFNPASTTDFFTPSNWQSLDGSDTDLVGAGPLVIDVAGATPSSLVVAMGKSGVMHLLDRSNLGGIGTGNGTTGEGLYSAQIGSGQLRGAAATYTTSSGTYIVVHTDGSGTSCPGGMSGDLVAVQITATSPPGINTVWCVNSGGNGSPIVTTTDSSGSNPIVWIAGTEGSNQLTGWDGITGAAVFNGAGVTMDTVIHWTTPIEVNGRIIVGSSDKLYVFTGM